MPEPRRQLVNQRNSMRKSKRELFPAQQSKITRKVRIICYDPDATDDSSSSEDEGGRERSFAKNPRRFVREITFCQPNVALLPPKAAAEPESSGQDSNYGGVKTLKPSNKKVIFTKSHRQSSSPYRGVRQRKWGKWAAEIRDPFKGVSGLVLSTLQRTLPRPMRRSGLKSKKWWQLLRPPFQPLIKATTPRRQLSFPTTVPTTTLNLLCLRIPTVSCLRGLLRQCLIWRHLLLITFRMVLIWRRRLPMIRQILESCKYPIWVFLMIHWALFILIKR